MSTRASLLLLQRYRSKPFSPTSAISIQILNLRWRRGSRRDPTGVSRMSSRGLGHIFIGEHSKMSPVPFCSVSLFILLVTTAISRTRCTESASGAGLGSRLGRRLLIFDKERASKSGASRKSRPIFTKVAQFSYEFCPNVESMLFLILKLS